MNSFGRQVSIVLRRKQPPLAEHQPVVLTLRGVRRKIWSHGAHVTVWLGRTGSNHDCELLRSLGSFLSVFVGVQQADDQLRATTELQGARVVLLAWRFQAWHIFSRPDLPQHFRLS